MFGLFLMTSLTLSNVGEVISRFLVQKWQNTRRRFLRPPSKLENRHLTSSSCCDGEKVQQNLKMKRDLPGS